MATTLFQIAWESGLTGVEGPRGIFAQAVPIEVLTEAEYQARTDGLTTGRSRPGAIPDALITVDGRRYLYDVKVVHLCPSRYWPTIAVASARGGAMQHRADAVPREYEAAARALDDRTDRHYAGLGQERPAGTPTAVSILAQFPPVRGLVFGSTACGGSREVGELIQQCAGSAAAREWRSIGARTQQEYYAFAVATMRRRVGFAAAVAHARLRLSRLQLMGHEGRTAARAVRPADAHTSPTVFEQARGAPLGAGGGRAGFAGGGML